MSWLLSGCAASTVSAWGPCPDRWHVEGGIDRGTLNGRSMLLAGAAGEEDNIDSNYEGYHVTVGLSGALLPPGECPTLGGTRRE